MIPSGKGVLDHLWTFLTGPQPKAELKLTVALDATEAQTGSKLMTQQLHPEYNLLLRLPEKASSLHSQLTILATPLQLQDDAVEECAAKAVHVDKC